MADSKVEQIVSLLYKRTQEGKVAWKRTAEENVFQASFPRSAVKVRRIGGPGVLGAAIASIQKGNYTVEILDSNGRVVEEVPESEFAVAIEGRAIKLSGLYEAARRSALGSDQTLDDLLSTLRREDSSSER